ncbi:ly6/PLAUR domain-containing protein 2-like, partial [Pyxicephalus adspersus]|uniref:ly6/PLAUR domain-containing protein 2-like n=1 Tax=Pyxicephalus adspersus TaxID=30357 RepID=UPI003B5C6D53
MAKRVKNKERQDSTMRRIVPFLVLVTITLDLVYCRLCYFCSEQNNLTNCLEVKQCKEGEQSCTSTTYQQADGKKVFTRGCAPSCLQSDPQNHSGERLTFCCNNDLCNTKELSPNSPPFSNNGSTLLSILTSASNNGSAGGAASGSSSTSGSSGSNNIVYNAGTSGSSGSPNVVNNAGTSGSSGSPNVVNNAGTSGS